MDATTNMDELRSRMSSFIQSLDDQTTDTFADFDPLESPAVSCNSTPNPTPDDGRREHDANKATHEVNAKDIATSEPAVKQRLFPLSAHSANNTKSCQPKSALQAAAHHSVSLDGSVLAHSIDSYKSRDKPGIPMASFSEEATGNQYEYDTVEMARSSSSYSSTAKRPRQQQQQQHQPTSSHKQPPPAPTERQAMPPPALPLPPAQLLRPGDPQRQQHITVNGRVYQLLNQMGKGGSSVVYQVYEEQSKALRAIKVVDLSDADEHVRLAYINEINLLKRLQNSDRVVKLFDHEQLPDGLYVVMERGDTDFGTFLKTRGKDDALSAKMIAFYWVEMLRAVQVIHKAGIVHSDLKPANFLLVGGTLKLIDFGIAAALPSNKTSIVKDCQMGTLSYMSPEAIKNSSADVNEVKYKVQFKSDVWSLGCMLYMMVYGRTPFQHVRDQYSKMMAIVNGAPISYEPVADPRIIDVIKSCLRRDVSSRPSVDQLLQHDYVTHNGAVAAACSPAKPELSEDQLLAMVQQMNSNTPNTNVRMLKRIVQRTNK